MSTIERIVKRIDQLNLRDGDYALWLVLLMVIVQFLIVLVSKVFNISNTGFDEIVWYCNGLIFMLGAGYTLLYNRHVRVDIFYNDRSSKYQALVDLFGSLFFILPVAAFTFGLSWNLVIVSWYNFNGGGWVLEGSDSPSGLPLLFLFKTVIWIYAFLIALAGLSLAGKAFLYLSGWSPNYELMRHKHDA